MKLLPGWEDRIQNLPEDATVPGLRFLPKATTPFLHNVTFVDTAEGAEAMVQLAEERRLSHIGVDTEYGYERPPVVLNRCEVRDPRSVRPLLLSLALCEPRGGTESHLYRFVVDLRKPGTHTPLARLLRLPVAFTGHFLQAEIHCLLKLDLPLPRIVWDTWVHEKALYLGRHHKRYNTKPGMDDADTARLKEETEEAVDFRLSLVSTCKRYGVAHTLAAGKERLQKSFLDHPEGAPFSQEQIDYAAEDAVAAARLYPLQVAHATEAGLLHHLVTVEMPWTITNARMVWNGARVDQALCREAEEACHRHLASLEPELRRRGVGNVKSPKQLTAFFASVGLLGLFKRNGRTTFDKDALGDYRDRHPAIPFILAARKTLDLLGDKILTGELLGNDGRVHPEYKQLGTHTGRQTSCGPNLLGLGRLFRPLVVPDPGHGLGEVDWSQIEIGVAAAVYQDRRLVQMFNSGDVYSAMAQDFYREDLPQEDAQLPADAFKAKHRKLRDQMKACTLGIIYGLTAHGLTQTLNVSPQKAKDTLGGFLSMFPELKEGLEKAAAYGATRGYASTVSGLRRHRAKPRRQVSTWERNWLTNHPVQGSAAVVFKAAGNRLDKLYQLHGARLIVPMHDAFVFEAPLEALSVVADLTARVMCDTVREYFPELSPQVEVNISRPDCWNKDGHYDAVRRWMEDPTYTF